MAWSPLIWWVAAALLVGAELLTGTFYLLAIAIAFAAGGLSAGLNLPLAGQLTIATLVGVVLVVFLWRWKARRPTGKLPASLDVGQPVQVSSWLDERRARVNYRGAQWDAELERVDVPRSSTLFISHVRGSTLILSDRPPQK